MSKYKIGYKYVWKELSSDGLLKDPEECGPYYDRDNINGYDYGFDSEQEAEQSYLEFKTKHEYGVSSSLVLVKLTRVIDTDWEK